MARIDRVRRSFFWKGDNKTSGGACLVSWDICCRPKCSGGLGILNLNFFNISLITKWWWKLMVDPSVPWASLVLHFYYRRHHHLQVTHLPAHHTSPFWKGVLRTTSFFRLGLRFVCGDGSNIRFWHDHWTHGIPLALRFPNLFDYAANQDSTIASNFLGDAWAPRFKTHLLPLACIFQLGSLLHLLQHQSISSQPDRISWAFNGSGSFTVKSMYKFIASPPSPTFQLTSIWSFKVPLKVKINLWLAAQNKLLTSDILSLRNIAQPFLCPFCQNTGETADHIFVTCSNIAPIWLQLLSLYRLPRPPNTLQAFLTSWRRRWVSARVSTSWDRIVSAMIWITWLERNKRIFQHVSTPLTSFLYRVLSLSNLWSSFL